MSSSPARNNSSGHTGPPLAGTLSSSRSAPPISPSESLTNQLDNDSVGQDLFKAGGHEGSADSLCALLQRHGFDLNSSEGNAFVDEDAGRLLGAFGPRL